MNENLNFVSEFIQGSISTLEKVSLEEIRDLAVKLSEIREKSGRIFFCGIGGSAANSSHASNDFRKLCGIESYCVTDNVSELTARINDEGWETSFSEYLKISKLNNTDGLFFMSVGGGSLNPPVSQALIEAAKYAKTVGASVLGIVGRDGGYIYDTGDAVVLIPNQVPKFVTPYVEGLTAVIWHLLVSMPELKLNETKW